MKIPKNFGGRALARSGALTRFMRLFCFFACVLTLFFAVPGALCMCLSQNETAVCAQENALVPFNPINPITCRNAQENNSVPFTAGETAGALSQSSEISGPVFVVTANLASLYESPSLTAKKIGQPLKHKTEIVLESTQVFGDEDFVFYKVQQVLQAEDGGAESVSGIFEPEMGLLGTPTSSFAEEPAQPAYVLCELVAPKLQTVQSIPNFNAKTNAQCTLFEAVEDLQAETVTYRETEILLAKGTRIFLYRGYNRKSEYTAVCMLHENDVIYGFLKTEVISPDGINPLIITCLTLILALLGIIFAWMFMKHQKKVKSSEIYGKKIKIPKNTDAE